MDNQTLDALKRLHSFCRSNADYRKSGNFADGLCTLVQNVIAKASGGSEQGTDLPKIASFSGMAEVLKKHPDLQVDNRSEMRPES